MCYNSMGVKVASLLGVQPSLLVGVGTGRQVQNKKEARKIFSGRWYQLRQPTVAPDWNKAAVQLFSLLLSTLFPQKLNVSRKGNSTTKAASDSPCHSKRVSATALRSPFVISRRPSAIFSICFLAGDFSQTDI